MKARLLSAHIIVIVHFEELRWSLLLWMWGLEIDIAICASQKQEHLSRLHTSIITTLNSCGMRERSNALSMLMVFFIFFYSSVTFFCCRTAPTLTRKQRKSLKEISDYVQNVVKSKKVRSPVSLLTSFATGISMVLWTEFLFGPVPVAETELGFT